MDSCWTSTGASAGKASTIPAVWRSTDIKVSSESLRDRKISHERCQNRTFELMFSVDRHIFSLFDMFPAYFKWVSWGLRGYETSVKRILTGVSMETAAGGV